MTDRNPTTCTALTMLIEGSNHKEAAEAILIQFADGGLDQDIEGRLEAQGFTVSDMGFSMEKGEMKITVE